MGRPYQKELDFLSTTYEAAVGIDVKLLVRCLASCRSLPLIAVGSGGSFTTAHFVASLHERFCGTVARPSTPLDAAALADRGRDLAVMLLTAGGSNPDVLGVFKHLAEVEPAKLAVLCGRLRSPLASQAAAYPYVDLFEYEMPGGKDGFLATNSLLWFAVLLARAYRTLGGVAQELPSSLDQLLHPGQDRSTFIAALRDKCEPLWSRPTLIVLHGPETASAAVDLESKFTEAALGVVQLADFRSFAHGRHHWLAKHGAESTVVALATKADDDIASRTLELLPRSIPTVVLRVPGEKVSASLAALGIALFMAGFAGIARGIDPGRPGVPAFGRKIYHLRTFHRRTRSLGTLAPLAAASIERKAGVPIERLKEQGQLKSWIAAYRGFLRRLYEPQFTSVVLDYDGTLCETKERQSGLGPEAATALSRIARAGLTVGIVTGRGKSVREDLQRELPKNLWGKFVIGYYNGSDIAPLAHGARPLTGDCCESLASVAELLQRDPILAGACDYETRPSQIAVRPRGSVVHSRVWEVLQHAISLGTSRATVVRSGHSLDILAEGVSKRAILDRLKHESPGPVLCIGDSGRWPGNDFALLAHECSLSSHEVSPDPRTCWNLSLPGQRGVAATLYYLRSLVPARSKAQMILRLAGHRSGSR